MPTDEMVSTADERRKGQPCACFACGKLVYPLPLDIPTDLRLPMERGHGSVGAVIEEGTCALHLVPCLLCPACAGPREVEIYRARFEPMVAGSHHDATAHADELTRAAAIALMFYVQLTACCKSASGAL